MLLQNGTPSIRNRKHIGVVISNDIRVDELELMT